MRMIFYADYYDPLCEVKRCRRLLLYLALVSMHR